MAERKPRRSVRDRVSAHRQRLRAQGLRPVQFWLPDVRSPEFAAEARRQCLAANASEHAQDDMDFVESITDFDFE